MRYDLQSEIVRNLANQITEKKQTVIKQRLQSLGLSSILDGLQKRRFKRIQCEKHPDREEWWIDNGTTDGLLLVTFYEVKNGFEYDDEGFASFKYDLQYK